LDAVTVEADQTRIEQVINQLLKNAVTYSPQGGDIEVSLINSDSEAILSVTDHGIGIPKNRQARIFERLYRAHMDTPYDYGGLGVGLFIAREIIHAHGGRIWFTSEPGQGSTFFFAIPTMSSKQTIENLTNSSALGNDAHS
jgi:signal transduction histidine kinase